MQSNSNLSWVESSVDATENLMLKFATEKELTFCSCHLEKVNFRFVNYLALNIGKTMLHLYTHDVWYTEINNILLNKEQTFYPLIDCMVKYMKLYSVDSQTLYRGSNVEPGHSLVLDRFTSFTTDIEVARSFGDHVMTVTNPPICLPMSELSYFPEEDEVLLPPCTRLEFDEDTGCHILKSRRQFKQDDTQECVQNFLCCCCYTCCLPVPMLMGTLVALCSVCSCCTLCPHYCLGQESDQSVLWAGILNDCEIRRNTPLYYVEFSNSHQYIKKAFWKSCLIIPGIFAGFHTGFCFCCPSTTSGFLQMTGSIEVIDEDPLIPKGLSGERMKRNNASQN